KCLCYSNLCVTMDKLKIRVIFEYEFRRGTNGHTRNINEVFGEDVTNERIVHRWFEKFHFGD
ncbi:Histone-lysine N-methyltransferase SETMAR, partial [Harpegnathos saltator]